ncbi:MAG TPA: retropepsin-like aspartic protease [Anaerolineae bacterium]
MRLPYLPVGGALKPLVQVTLISQRPLITRALVDSGADFSIFDLSILAYLGTPLDPGLQRRVTGIGGTITAHGTWIDAIIGRHRLHLLMFFAPNLPMNLLGRDNFFHYFRVSFDEVRHEVDLRYRRQRPTSTSSRHT